MSFLNAVKPKVGAPATGAPVNPFLKNKPTTNTVNPFLKNKSAEAKTVPETKVENKPKTDVKKEVKEDIAKKAAEEVIKAAENKDEKKIEEDVKKMDIAEVEELIEEKIPEEVVQEEKKFDPTVAQKIVTVAENNANTDETKSETKKTTRTRKNSKEKTEKVEETKTETIVETIVDTPEEEEREYIEDFSEAAQAIKIFAVDPVWKKFEEDVKEQLKAIVLSYDMDTIKVKKALVDLNTLKDSIGFEYVKTKSEYENLVSKDPKGLIERVEKTTYNNDIDKNDRDRTRAGIRACYNFKDKNTGKFVDLFVLKDQYKVRYDFLKYVMDTLSFKEQCLRTMNSAVKQEGDLAKHTNN